MTDPRDRSRDDRPQKPYVGGADAVPDTVQGAGHGTEPEQERRMAPRGAPPAEGRSAVSAGWIIAFVALIVVIVLMFGVFR